jgi:hypothetical protein
MPKTIPDLISSVASQDDSFGEFARKWSLLPVYMDMGGTLAIDPEGRVFSHGHDDPGPPQPENEDYWRFRALVAAGRLFPELAYLKPAPPQGASSCSACSGTGFVVRSETSYCCGACHSTGWVANPATKSPVSDGEA